MSNKSVTHTNEQKSKTGYGLLKPLTIAISGALLAACASTPATVSSTTTGTNTSVIGTQTSSNNQSASGYQGVLDQDTLNELEDLLQATDMSMVEGDSLTVQRYGDLWNRVRTGYRMSNLSNERIEAQKSWFYSRQDYINRLAARTSRYLHHTVTEAERRGIPTELALLPIIESSYDPSATSNAAAAGLWQFIPSTGRVYGLNQSSSYDGRRDIIESTRAAYDFLTSLYNQFGSWELALAAYNAGPGRIQKAIDANRTAGLPTDYWSLRLPTETMNYVPRFMAVAQIIKSPSSYGITLPPIANHTHFRAVPANYGVSLADISRLTGVSIDELRLLNPSLTRLTVDKSGPGRVVIPNSLPSTVDASITALQGSGFGATTYTASSYVTPMTGVSNAESAKSLAQSNTLPTTGSNLTVNNSIIQEPPLSEEERDFIAAQIQANSIDGINPIASDGNIGLNAIQTQQSVLEARGATKSLTYNTGVINSFDGQVDTSAMANNTTLPMPAYTPPVTTQNTVSTPSYEPETSTQKTSTKSNTQSTSKPESHKVTSGDTLSSIAAKNGLSVSQLASFNNVDVNYKVKRGERIWLVDGKVKKTNKTTTSTTTAKQSEAKTSQTPKTSTHTVKSGESLTLIAKRYNMSVSDLAKLNNLSTTDGVLIGQKLKVVGESNENAKNSAKQSSTAETKTTKTNEPVKKTNPKYIVKSGDSLHSIANKFKVSVNDLAKANNMDSDAGLIVGKTITIPLAGVETTNKSSDNKTKNQASSTESKKDNKKDAVAKGKVISSTENYTVKSGDSLNSLAAKYGVSANDLAATNKLASNASLKRGQVIKVPKSANKSTKATKATTATYTAKSGDSLNTIAKKYGISVAELAKLNKLSNDAKIKIGQKLTVPNK